MPAPLRSVLVRRIFTLTGVVPLGAFLAVHLAINAFALRGDAPFARVVDALARVPGLPLLEAVFVFAPLLLHGAIGLSLVVTQTPLMAQSPYPPAVRVAMRATGAVALAFLAMHLTEFRFRTPGARLGGSELGTLVAADLSATWGGVPWRGVAYLAGTACVAFHFAAGVWGFLAALPALAQSARRRTWAAWGAAALGGALWIAFANLVVFHATGARLLGVPAEAEGGGEPCPAPDAHRP